MANRALPKPPHYVPRAVSNSNESKLERRRKAIQELYDAEARYNALLTMLIQYYVTPLSDYQIITEKQHKTLFPELQSIKELSDTFLNELNKRRLSSANNAKLSDLFNRFIPFFRMYQAYLNNYDKTLCLLQQLSQNKKWMAFCQKAEQNCKHVPLSDLLIVPSEQLVKYDAILSNILQRTDSLHIDYNDLIVSQQSFNNELQYMKIKMLEHIKKGYVRKIERKFKGEIHLSEPHRSFIRDGKLWKISARSNKHRLYHFFLFNDILIYASSFGNKYKIHNMLPINEKFHVDLFQVNTKYGKEKEGRIFSIKSEKKSIVVYADTIAIAQEWIRQLNICIAQQNAPDHRQSRSAKKAFNKTSPFTAPKAAAASAPGAHVLHHRRYISTETLPVWVPDSHVTHCSVCNTKFTFTNRKHHCRKCGAVVCNKCSKYKVSNSDGVQKRACRTCYIINTNELRKQQTDNTVDDDSDASDFENEIQCLYAVPYFIETSDYQWIFDTFQGVVGSYMLIPCAMGSDEYYYVNLVVYTNDGFEIFKISLFEKKQMVFRLVQTGGNNSKDFDDMKMLLKYIESQYGNIKFIEPMLRSTVETGVSRSVGCVSVCCSNSNLERYPKAKALYDYESKTEDDLTFKTGDTIFICDKSDTYGWWRGFVGDCIGLFPSNYVQILNEDYVAYDQEEKVDRNVLNEIETFDAYQIEMECNEGVIEDVKEKENAICDDVNHMKHARRHFYNFLKRHNLERYFDNFVKKECCDIRDIEYLMDEGEFLKNEIAIENPIHRKKLLGELTKLKSKMDEFKQVMNIVPDMLMVILLSFGIVTMEILCSEIKQKSDLKYKLKIETDSQCDLLWNIIEKQLHPNTDYSQTNMQTEGGELDSLDADALPPKIPPVPKEDNAELAFPETPKMTFVTRDNDNDDDDENDNIPVPPPPPIDALVEFVD